MLVRNFRVSVAVCFLGFVLCSVNAGDDKKSETSRIINGNSIHISQAPYIVQLRILNGGLLCGGTLVSPLYVLSAAHCFDIMPHTSIVVVGGANTNNAVGVRRRIADMRKPDIYTRATMDSDVAVLKLESPMVGPNITPVPLCTVTVPEGGLMDISGWGATSSDGFGSTDLRTIRIPAVTRQQCKLWFRNGTKKITKNMFCALSPNKDSCQGDSGGPAIYNGQLCGIISWGAGCAAGIPGVYTDVTALRQFIDTAMQTM